MDSLKAKKQRLCEIVVNVEDRNLSAEIGIMAFNNSDSVEEISGDYEEHSESKQNLQPEEEILNAIFPSSAVLNSEKRQKYLKWYSHWLRNQIDALPDIITNRVSHVYELLLPVAFLFSSGRTIDGVSDLILSEFIAGERDESAKYLARTLAFTILGWQTMLYVPSVNTCPREYFAVTDRFDGHTIPAFLQLRQDLSRTRLPLCDFLVGFGLILPSQNICLCEDQDIRQAFEKASIVRPSEFNAALLVRFGKIRIEWTDVLSAHLEFDTETKTLYLFQYPSFCLASIPESRGSGFLGKEAQEMKSLGVIHSCASDRDGEDNWASKEDVTQHLIEIILSYRLLFGQNSESRRIFRKIDPFKDVPSTLRDPLLEELCTSQGPSLPDFVKGLEVKEREYYRHKRDFPILRSRIAVLQQDLSEWTPRGWSDIWNDKRNSAGWYTFWTVLIIGGAGIILAVIQVALQAAQIAGAGAD